MVHLLKAHNQNAKSVGIDNKYQWRTCFINQRKVTPVTICEGNGYDRNDVIKIGGGVMVGRDY